MNIGFYTKRQSELVKQLKKLEVFLEEKLPQTLFECFDEYEMFQEYSNKYSWNMIYYDAAGIDLETAKEHLQELRTNYPKAVIVIVAENAELAVFGYSVNAFDYLMGAVEEETLVDSMKRIIRERFSEMINSFSVRVKGAWTKLDIQQVCYLETYNHHIYFHTDDGKVFKRMGNFNDLHTELTCNPMLFQCHKSYVVNGMYIEAITQGSFMMKDGRKISISRPYRKASRKFFAQSASQRCS